MIVLEGIYDAFLARLVEAAQGLKVGPADDPETARRPGHRRRGPRARSSTTIEIARQEGRVVLDGDVGALAERGLLRRPA